MNEFAEKYGNLAAALKIIYVWASNPSDDALADLELIKNKAEETLRKVELLK